MIEDAPNHADDETRESGASLQAFATTTREPRQEITPADLYAPT
ncbi:MAG: hypothetical protein WDO13_09265 [Verrucomicrobiota bacterium]